MSHAVITSSFQLCTNEIQLCTNEIGGSLLDYGSVGRCSQQVSNRVLQLQAVELRIPSYPKETTRSLIRNHILLVNLLKPDSWIILFVFFV